MALELRQQLKLTQQLVMTPQLQLAIKLLQLSRLELMETIRQELEDNPTLEEIHEAAPEEQIEDYKESASSDTTSVKEVSIEEKIPDDNEWSNYLDEYNSIGRVHFETEIKNAVNFDNFIAKKETLKEHLLWQLLMTSPTKDEEEIGSLIIGNLNRDGYLDASIEDIAEQSGSTPDKVEKILLTIQKTFDPVGICARDLCECLLIQIRHYGIDNTVVTQIVKNHLNHLENKNYKAICKACEISIDDVISAVKVIRGLDPRPGQQISDEEPHYITPDIFVYKLDNEFIITLNDDGLPKLGLNLYYKNAIGQGNKLSDKAKVYLNDKMRSATWLIKSIYQRQKTIYRVMESILKFQKDFFEKGVEYLNPMVLRDVAEDVGMHESTISRVTTNKYAYTPLGIYELKYFFNSSINRVNGGSIASASVQEKIRNIIKSEDPQNPYSDDKISTILEEENITIARRTIAKYREIMKVLPSNKRKQF